jgi:replicative DNA helicase
MNALGYIPPQNLEAEKAVLGSMMIDDDIVIDVLDLLIPDDFYREDYKEIYTAISELSNKLEAIDYLSVSERLKTRGTAEQVGGLEVLVNMTNGIPTTANVIHYANIVLECSKRRKLIKTASGILKASYENNDVSDIIDNAEREILSVNDRQKNNFCMASEAVTITLNELEKRYKNKGKITGLITGFCDIDNMLGGLQNGDLVLIAARPAMGKTALAENIITFTSCIKKLPVAFFSMEMPKEAIINRMFSGWGRVENTKIKLGNISDEDWVKITRVSGEIYHGKLAIDDTPHMRSSEMRSKCRRIKNKLGDLRLIVVDHLTEMWRPNKSNRDSTEHEENVRSLKRLAREINCPVILLQQLNRDCEKRQDKRPMLSDLKETGASEEAADVAMFIYRDDYYNKDSTKKNIAEIIIAKNRGGATGTIELNWQGQYTKFASIERYHQEHI